MAFASTTSPYTIVSTEAPDYQAEPLEDHEPYEIPELPYDDYGEVHLATTTEKKRLWWRTTIITGLFVTSWFGFATLLSVYNKWMFSPDHYAFPFPLFVSAVQMSVQFSLAAFIRAVWPKQFKSNKEPTRDNYLKKVIPTAVTTGLDIGFSNMSLKAITLSFYTMCKSSSLIFVLAFAFFFRLEQFSLRLIGVIFLIFTGVVLMVATETHFVLGGFLLVTSASALSGLRWSLTQLLLRNKNMGLDNPPTTLYWLTPAMGVTLGLVSVFVESWTILFNSEFFRTPAMILRTSFFLFAPGVVAFCMVVSEYYVIQRAGVVTMSITAVAKEVTTIMVSAVVFGDELTPLNVTGVGLTMCGISLYTYHKYKKSIDSHVPLDAHGNPVPADDENSESPVNGVILSSASSFELRERERLASSYENRTRGNYPAPPIQTAESDDIQVLFEVAGSDEDDEDDPTHERGAQELELRYSRHG